LKVHMEYGRIIASGVIFKIKVNQTVIKSSFYSDPWSFFKLRRREFRACINFRAYKTLVPGSQFTPRGRVGANSRLRSLKKTPL
jgi:hypothetical protein